jgi:hypothetical protein
MIINIRITFFVYLSVTRLDEDGILIYGPPRVSQQEEDAVAVLRSHIKPGHTDSYIQIVYTPLII